MSAEHMGVNAEHTRTELRFTKDERLLVGVRGAIEHIGGRHGVKDEERADVAAAAEQACRKALGQGECGLLCVVTIDDFEDRVEVSIEGRGSSQHAKLNSGEDEAEIKKRVDRADFAVSNGHARTMLVKYFHKKPAHS